MSRRERTETKTKTKTTALPAARVLVVGERAHGTEEVAEGLRSLAAKKPPWASRRTPPDDARRESGFVGHFNDFGPKLGAPTVVTFETPKRSYAGWVCVDGASSVALTMSRRVDAVVLVRSAREVASDGVAMDLLDVTEFLGAKCVVVYVTDVSGVARSGLDATELRARELLSVAGFDGDAAPVIYETAPIDPSSGSAWQAGVIALRDALDEHTPHEPPDAPEALFLVDGVFPPDARRRTVLAGFVDRGKVSVGDELELVSRDDRRVVLVDDLEVLRRSVASIARGQPAAVLVANVAVSERSAPCVLASPGAVTMVDRVRGRAYVWPAEPSARDRRDREPIQLGPASLSVARGRRPTPVQVEWLAPVGPGPGRRELSLELESSVPWYPGVTYALHGYERVVAILLADSPES